MFDYITKNPVGVWAIMTSQKPNAHIVQGPALGREALAHGLALLSFS